MSVRTKVLAATTALALLATPFAATAESLHYGRSWGGPGTPLPGARSHGYYHGGYRYYPRGSYRYPHGYYYYGHRYDNAGAAVAAGIAGLAVGTIIGSAASSPSTYYYSGSPGSAAWYRYCASRYRSFDPRSGTYLGYDGYRHYCR